MYPDSYNKPLVHGLYISNINFIRMTDMRFNLGKKSGDTRYEIGRRCRFYYFVIENCVFDCSAEVTYFEH